MKEKEIKTEKVEKKKVYRKPKKVVEETKVKDDEINNMILNSGEVYQNVIKTPKQAGIYLCTGRGHRGALRSVRSRVC